MSNESKLYKAFNFDEEDLEANRLGAFSEQQKNRLSLYFMIQRIVVVAGGIAFVILGVWFIWTQKIYCPGSFMVVLGVILMAWMWRLGSISVHDMHVQHSSGLLGKEIVVNKGKSYFLNVGGQRFQITATQSNAVQEGEFYSVYFCKREVGSATEAPILLALEITTEYPEKKKKREAV